MKYQVDLITFAYVLSLQNSFTLIVFKLSHLVLISFFESRFKVAIYMILCFFCCVEF